MGSCQPGMGARVSRIEIDGLFIPAARLGDCFGRVNPETLVAQQHAVISRHVGGRLAGGAVAAGVFQPAGQD